MLPITQCIMQPQIFSVKNMNRIIWVEAVLLGRVTRAHLIIIMLESLYRSGRRKWCYGYPATIDLSLAERSFLTSQWHSDDQSKLPDYRPELYIAK